MAVEATLDLGDATRLYEKEVTRLRGEMGHATRAQQEAVQSRDKALAEVTTLQKEKNSLVVEIEKVKASKQQILDSLAETRKNVEASLAKRENEANVFIGKATEKDAEFKAREQRINQLQGQMDGVKRTFRDEVNAISVRVAELVKKTNEALSAIPDLKK